MPPEVGQLATWFDGKTYDPALDEQRFQTALGRVYAALRPGAWWTLRELADVAECSEAGVSARLRDLRKPRFGSYPIESRRRAGGTWEYRMGDG